jgi:hypothetical protein
MVARNNFRQPKKYIYIYHSNIVIIYLIKIHSNKNQNGKHWPQNRKTHNRVWRTIMEATLKGKDLYEYILNIKMDTPDEQVKNEQAKTVMYCTMNSQQIAATGVCRSARDLWLKIREPRRSSFDPEKRGLHRVLKTEI